MEPMPASHHYRLKNKARQCHSHQRRAPTIGGGIPSGYRREDLSFVRRSRASGADIAKGRRSHKQAMHLCHRAAPGLSDASAPLSRTSGGRRAQAGGMA